MSINASRDQNRIATLLGASSSDGVTPVLVYADPVTHRLYVDVSGNIISGSAVGALALEAPVGVVDGVNTVFGVINTPLWVTVNGQEQYAGYGFTVSGTTIIFDTAPTAGSIIISHYVLLTGNSSNSVESLIGTIDGSNTNFTVNNVPLWITQNGQELDAVSGYTINGLVVTFATPPVPGDILRSHFLGSNTGLPIIEQPVGVKNGTNKVFTVNSVPLWVTNNGMELFEGNGYARSNLTLTFDTAPLSTDSLYSYYANPNNIAVTVTGGPVAEVPTGLINSSNTIYTVTQLPLWLTLNGQEIYEGQSYTRVGLTITMLTAPTTGDVLKSHYFTNGTLYAPSNGMEIPLGTIDGTNTVFAVNFTPLWITVNGQDLYLADGYSLSGLTVTFDTAPAVNSIIESHFYHSGAAVMGGNGLETPAGVIDGTNTVFLATNPPIWVALNGQAMYTQLGYTQANLYIIFDTAPALGDVIKVHY